MTRTLLVLLFLATSLLVSPALADEGGAEDRFHEAYVLEDNEWLIEDELGMRYIARFTGRTRTMWHYICPTIERYNNPLIKDPGGTYRPLNFDHESNVGFSGAWSEEAWRDAQPVSEVLASRWTSVSAPSAPVDHS